MRKILSVTLLVFALAHSTAHPHCQIPCGIYDDQLRIKLIREHIDTIERSMNTIISLSEEKDKNYNQIVRWVNNKDEHADEISRIAMYYFLAQRLEPLEKGADHYDEYIKELSLWHELIYLAMKAKQTTDTGYIKKMRDTVDELEPLALEQEGHSHR